LICPFLKWGCVHMTEPKNSLPLTSDTGATSPTWGIDWLAMTIWGMEADSVARMVSEVFHFGHEVPLSGWQEMGGARFYRHRHEYLGATLLTECYSKGAADNVHVVFPGEACHVGAHELLRLSYRLSCRATRFEVTRLDLAVDGVPFTPHDAYQAVKDGHTVSWVKRGRDGVIAHSWIASNGQNEGSTLYIGRPASERRLRIYDKRGPTRIELQTRSKYAGAVAKSLFERREDEPGQAEFVIGCLREFCDFGAQDGVHGIRDIDLLPWWREFIGSAERIGQLVNDPREHVSVDRTLRWIDRAVVPSLAMSLQCYGDAGRRLLDAEIEYATPRLSAKHKAAIREFRHAYRHLLPEATVEEESAA
jgi:Replication initiation factor